MWEFAHILIVTLQVFLTILLFIQRSDLKTYQDDARREREFMAQQIQLIVVRMSRLIAGFNNGENSNAPNE